MSKGIWSYLLVHSARFGEPDDVRDMLDADAKILNWVRVAPYAFLIVSRLSATSLADRFRDQHLREGHFLLLDTATDRNGWLPRDTWRLMRNPRPVGVPDDE
jgi:hypothetical protein